MVFSIRRCCNRVRANANAPRNDPETIKEISHAEHRLLKLWRREEMQTGDSLKIVRDSKSVKFAADSARLFFDGISLSPTPSISDPSG